MPFLLCYELVGDGSLWAVANGPSLEEMKEHVSKYAAGTTFTVYEVPADFDFKQRLSPPIGSLAPVMTWSDGGSFEEKKFLEETVTFTAPGGKAGCAFTITVAGLPKTASPVVGWFSEDGTLIGRTEMVSNTDSAVFQKNFMAKGNPKDSFDLKFSVYDGKDLSVDTFLGSATVPFSKVLGVSTECTLHGNDGAAIAGASLTVVKKPKPVKEVVPQQKKKDKSAKNAEPAAPDPKALEKLKAKSLKEGGKKGQDIVGLHEMGGVSFFHVSLESTDADIGLMETALGGFNLEVDEGAEDRKGGAGFLGKFLFSYNIEKLSMICHMPDVMLSKFEVTLQDWVDVVVGSMGAQYVTTLSMDTNVWKGEIIGNPDLNLYPIKLRDAAIGVAYNWLVTKKLVLPDDEDDDEIAFGDDDFPDYYDETPAPTAEPVATPTTTAATIFADIDVGKYDGQPEFLTYDNDAIHGKKCPPTTSLQFLNADKYAIPVANQVQVLVLWGQYHKPGYKFLPLYSQLQAKYGSKVCFVGVSIDPDADYPGKFLEDPNKKYSKGEFTTEFLIAWDKDGALKKALMEEADSITLSPPHAYVLTADGKIVWHQDHSELGATAPSYLGLMEEQIDAVLAGTPLKKVGDRPEKVYEEEDEEDGEAVDIADDDLFFC